MCPWLPASLQLVESRIPSAGMFCVTVDCCVPASFAAPACLALATCLRPGVEIKTNKNYFETTLKRAHAGSIAPRIRASAACTSAVQTSRRPAPCGAGGVQAVADDKQRQAGRRATPHLRREIVATIRVLHPQLRLDTVPCVTRTRGTIDDPHMSPMAHLVNSSREED